MSALYTFSTPFSVMIVCSLLVLSYIVVLRCPGSVHPFRDAYPSKSLCVLIRSATKASRRCLLANSSGPDS